MIEDIKVDFKEWLDEESHILYNSESNFNNADPTSAQRCYDEAEIRNMLLKAIKEELSW